MEATLIDQGLDLMLFGMGPYLRFLLYWWVSPT